MNMILKQAPLIDHNLKVVGDEISEMLAGLNVENQVVTVDTLQAVKKMRTEVNKKFNEYESQRKAIDKAVKEPLKDLYVEYDKFIKVPCTTASATLKTRIDECENILKDEKKANLVSYFNELIDSYEIDFLKFDVMNLSMLMSTTEKAYKDQINEFVEKVSRERDHIKTIEFADEIMLEYKKTLDATLSITTVQKRKAELKRIEDVKKLSIMNARKNDLIGIGLLHDTELNAYFFDDETNISWAVVEVMDDKTFAATFSGLEAAIKAKTTQPVEDVEATPQPKEPAAPLKSPEKKVTVEVMNAEFRVTGTYSQLKALGAYMKANNIIYTNI